MTPLVNNSYLILKDGSGKFVLLDSLLTENTLGIGLRKDEPDFKIWLNNFIMRIKKDGTYNNLYKKWFNVESPLKKKE